MVSKPDVIKGVRQNVKSAKRCNSGGGTSERTKFATPRRSTSVSLSRAVFSMGPYTYLVRQPGSSGPLRESRCDAPERGPSQSQIFAALDRDNARRHQHEGNYDADRDAPLWISPVLSKQRQEKEAVWFKEPRTILESTVSPQPRPLRPSWSAESGKRNKNVNKLEPRQTLTSSSLSSWRSQTFPQQQCGTDMSVSSTKILTELLHQMRQHRDAGGSSARFFDQSENLTEDDDLQSAPQKQTRGCGPPLSLQSDGGNKKNGPGVRTPVCREAHCSPTAGDDSWMAGPHFGGRTAPDTVEGNEGLLRGVRKYEGRTCRGLSGPESTFDEDTTALRVFTDYLKKKADRLERDCDELFELSHPEPISQGLQHCRWSTQRLQSSREGSRNMVVGGAHYLPNDHLYCIDARAKERERRQGTFFSKSAMRKGEVFAGPFSKTQREASHNMPTIAAHCTDDDDDDTDTNTVVSHLPKQRGRQSKRTSGFWVAGDTRSFYTGRSLRAEINQKTKRCAVSRSSSLSSFASKQEASIFEDLRKLTGRNTPSPSPVQTPPPPPPPPSAAAAAAALSLLPQELGQTDEKLTEKFSGVTREERETATSDTLVDRSSAALQFSEKSQLRSGAILNTFSPPGTLGLHDISVLTRLHEYSTELEAALGRIVGVEKEGGHKHGVADTDVVMIPANPQRGEATSPVQKILAIGRSAVGSAVSHRRNLLSPAPSLLHTPASDEQPHRTTEVTVSNSVSDRLVVSSATPNTSVERGVFCGMNDREWKTGCRSALEENDRSTLSRSENLVAGSNLQLSPASGPHTPQAPVLCDPSRCVSPISDEPPPVVAHGSNVEKTCLSPQREVWPAKATKRSADPSCQPPERVCDETVSTGCQPVEGEKTGAGHKGNCEVNYAALETPKEMTTQPKKNILQVSSVDESVNPASTRTPTTGSMNHMVYSCTALTKRSEDAPKNRGSEGVMECGARSCTTHEDGCGFELPDELELRQEHCTLRPRRRFSADASSVRSVAETPMSRTCVPPAKFDRNDIGCTTNRGSCGGGGSGAVEGIRLTVTPGNHANKNTSERKINKVFVSVFDMNNGGRQQIARNFGEMSVPASRRFGLPRPHQ